MRKASFKIRTPSAVFIDSFSEFTNNGCLRDYIFYRMKCFNLTIQLNYRTRAAFRFCDRHNRENFNRFGLVGSF